MVKVRGDRSTPDLLDWEPPLLVQRYDETQVRAASLRARIAKALAETLKAAPMPREQIAAKMSDWLGEDVSKNMLDAYASEAREEQTVSMLRLAALIHVTGDMRLLQLIAEMFGHAVVDEKYLTWVEVGQLADKKVSIDRAFEAAQRNARRRS